MNKYIILILILVISCSRHSDTGCECGKEFTSNLEKGTPEGIYYQSEDFATTAIDEFTIDYVKENFSGQLKLTLIPKVNDYDEKTTDTIYQFSNNGNLIEFYRTKDNDFLQSFDVSDSVFKIKKCIGIGISKECLCRKFGIKEIIGDTITIGDTEHSSAFIFYFRSNRICRIVNTLYLE